MAKHVFYNASVTVNAVDLSDHVEKIEWEDGVESAGSGAAMPDSQNYDLPGMMMISDVKITFFQDFAASKVYATIHPLVVARSTFNIVVKNDAGATSATNPAFTLPVFVKSFPVFKGSRGERHMSEVVFSPAGTQTIATA